MTDEKHHRSGEVIEGKIEREDGELEEVHMIFDEEGRLWELGRKDFIRRPPSKENVGFPFDLTEEDEIDRMNIHPLPVR